MSDNIKLYKCYKGTCSKCLNEEDPYITADEYKELLDADGKVQCPEGHLDCGIQELKPEDYPKPPKDNKKLFIIGGGILVVVLLIAGVVFMFSGKSKYDKAAGSMKSVGNAVGVIKDSLDKPNTPDSKASDNNPIRQDAASGNKDQSMPIAEPKVEEKKGEIDKSAPDILTASSLENGLQKIGDTKYSLSQRKALLPKVLSKFENSTVMVTVSMNNNKYEYFTVDKYLNRILIQGIKNISVKNETKNNAGLVNELSVNE